MANYKEVTRKVFKKKKSDFYPTIDDLAYSVIDSVLPCNSKFVEPCAGRGDLINGLKPYGHRCTFASDLIIRKKTPDYVHEMDALSLTKKHCKGADFIITNPPFTRSVMHPMIPHFASILPTWFLLESNWANTLQAYPYLKRYCLKIVVIGRLKWVKNSTAKSVKDYALYLFDADKTKKDLIEFIPRKKA